MGFLSKMFGQKEVYQEVDSLLDSRNDYLKFYPEHKEVYDKLEKINSEIMVELFNFIRTKDLSSYVFLDESFDHIINKLIEINKLEFFNPYGNLLFGTNIYNPCDKSKLDAYSFGIYLYNRAYVEKYENNNLNMKNEYIFSLFLKITTKVEKYYTEAMQKNRDYKDSYSAGEKKILNQWRFSRDWYFNEPEKAIEANILLEENTFVNYMLDYDNFKENYRSQLFFENNYSSTQAFSIVFRKPGSFRYIEEGTEDYKKVLEEKFDLYNYYYERLYSLDMDVVLFDMLDEIPENGSFKDAPIYYKFYKTNTYNNPAWKKDSVYKMENHIFSKAFFEFFIHINVNYKHLLPYCISEATYHVMGISLTYYLNNNEITPNFFNECVYAMNSLLKNNKYFKGVII